MGYSAKIYARIGELMQGVLPDASAFLISGLPSRQWFSETTVEAGAVNHPGASAGQPSALPPKAAEALTLLLDGQPWPDDSTIILQSNIPKSKGLSSSSTDILSVLVAASHHLGLSLDKKALYRIAAQVEPTDPCLSDDIVVFYQHKGEQGQTVDLPPLALLYFDAAPDHHIDTVTLQRRWPPDAGKFFERLLHRFLDAAANRDYDMLFDCITRSANYNQSTLPTPGFDRYHDIAHELHAGLMVAHSGTIAGLLVRPEQEAAARERLEALPIFTEHYSSPHPTSLCRSCSAP